MAISSRPVRPAVNDPYACLRNRPVKKQELTPLSELFKKIVPASKEDLTDSVVVAPYVKSLTSLIKNFPDALSNEIAGLTDDLANLSFGAKVTNSSKGYSNITMENAGDKFLKRWADFENDTINRINNASAAIADELSFKNMFANPARGYTLLLDYQKRHASNSDSFFKKKSEKSAGQAAEKKMEDPITEWQKSVDSSAAATETNDVIEETHEDWLNSIEKHSEEAEETMKQAEEDLKKGIEDWQDAVEKEAEDSKEESDAEWEEFKKDSEEELESFKQRAENDRDRFVEESKNDREEFLKGIERLEEDSKEEKDTIEKNNEEHKDKYDSYFLNQDGASSFDPNKFIYNFSNIVKNKPSVGNIGLFEESDNVIECCNINLSDMVNSGLDYLSHKFDVFLVEYNSSYSIDSLFTKPLNSKGDISLNSFMSLEGFNVRFGAITVPALKNETFEINIGERIVKKLRSSKVMSRKANFTFRLDYDFYWQQFFRQAAGLSNNGVRMVAKSYGQPIGDSNANITNKKVCMILKRADLSEYSVMTAGHNRKLTLAEYANSGDNLYVLEDIRIVGTDAIQYSVDGGTQNVSVDFIFKRSYYVRGLKEALIGKTIAGGN